MISAASFSASSAPILGGAGGATAPRSLSASVNSGKSASVFHSLLPSDHTLVCALARRSAIHLPTCSAGTGPYSLWSAPMILYTVVLSLSENTNPRGEVAINNPAGGQSDGKSGGRRGHQFLKLRFGLATFKQSNRLL